MKAGFPQIAVNQLAIVEFDLIEMRANEEAVFEATVRKGHTFNRSLRDRNAAKCHILDAAVRRLPRITPEFDVRDDVSRRHRRILAACCDDCRITIQLEEVGKHRAVVNALD